MKKNNFWSMVTMIMVVFVSVGFVSCGGDDGESSSASNYIVGTWKIVGGDQWAQKEKGQLRTFNADGTCEWGSSGTYTNWKLSGNKLLLTRKDGRTEEYIAEFKNDQLHLTFPDGDATEYTILVKVDIEKDFSNITRDFFIGTWEASGGHAYGTWVFSTNGYCTFSYTAGGGSKQSISGTWSYNPETRELTTTLQSWHWVIVNVTSDEWTGDNGQSYKRVK